MISTCWLFANFNSQVWPNGALTLILLLNVVKKKKRRKKEVLQGSYSEVITAHNKKVDRQNYFSCPGTKRLFISSRLPNSIFIIL
jgi:hypothetical protein